MRVILLLAFTGIFKVLKILLLNLLNRNIKDPGVK